MFIVVLPLSRLGIKKRVNDTYVWSFVLYSIYPLRFNFLPKSKPKYLSNLQIFHRPTFSFFLRDLRKLRGK